MTEAVVFCELCGKGINPLAGETVYICNSCKKKACKECSSRCGLCKKYVCHDYAIHLPLSDGKYIMMMFPSPGRPVLILVDDFFSYDYRRAHDYSGLVKCYELSEKTDKSNAEIREFVKLMRRYVWSGGAMVIELHNAVCAHLQIPRMDPIATHVFSGACLDCLKKFETIRLVKEIGWFKYSYKAVRV